MNTESQHSKWDTSQLDSADIADLILGDYEKAVRDYDLSWERIDGEDWARILIKLPQLADKCDWSKVTNLDWVELLRKRPKFVELCKDEDWKSRMWNVLTESNWSWLLEAQPQLAQYKPCFCEEVVAKIKDFLNSGSELPGNERALQMRLAMFLAKNEDWNVDLEYYLPSSVLPTTKDEDKRGYMAGWGKKLYLDIVVSKKNDPEYLPIELKFKTKSLKLKRQLNRFGQGIDETAILADHLAQDEGRYDFWRDVRRLQLVCNRFFPNVKNGIVVFVTNDSSYRNSPNKPVESVQFNMESEEKAKQLGCERGWKTPRDEYNDNQDKPRPVSRPDFEIEESFSLEWLKQSNVSFTLGNKRLNEVAERPKCVDNRDFYCCIAVVGKTERTNIHEHQMPPL